LFTDGLAPSDTEGSNIDIYDSRMLAPSALTGTTIFINGNGLNSVVALSYRKAAYLYYSTVITGVVPLAGCYSGTHFYPDTNNVYDLGNNSVPLAWRAIYVTTVNSTTVNSTTVNATNVIASNDVNAVHITASISVNGSIGNINTVNSLTINTNTLNLETTGEVVAGGTSGSPFPSGWSSSGIGVGYYRVTHNLGTTSYTVTANAELNGLMVAVDRSANSFTLRVRNTSNADFDSNVMFHLIKHN